jgi:hypothetical protein
MKQENVIVKAIRGAYLNVEDIEAVGKKLKASLENMNNQPYIVYSCKSERIFRNNKYIISSTPILKKH